MGALSHPLLPCVIDALGTRGSRLSSGLLSTSQLERVVFGLLIVGFLIFEPLGLYGIWIRSLEPPGKLAVLILSGHETSKA